MHTHTLQVDPIYKVGTNGHAVLLIHGFTATPDCMRPLAHHLQQNGYTVSAPLLAGHGHSVKQLAKSRWPDWMRSVKEAHASLIESHQHVFVVGQSLGGLLALKLALDDPRHVAGLGLLATPIELPKLIQWGVFAISHSPLIWLYPHQKKKHGPDIHDPEAKQNFYNLDAMPIACVQSLINLQALLRKSLAQIKTPTLIMHAKADSTAPYASMDYIKSHLGAKSIETVTLEHSYHIITVDHDRDLVCKHVLAFVNRFAKL